MLVDVQGYEIILCDPGVATMSTNCDKDNKLLFCMGNMSDVAGNNFFSNHKCNDICKLLELPEVRQGSIPEQ